MLLGKSIQVILKGNSYAIAKTDKIYPEFVKALEEKKSEDELLRIIHQDVLRVQENLTLIEHSTEDVLGGGSLEIRQGVLYFNNEPVNRLIGERMLQALDEGFNLLPYYRFLQRLEKNPDYRVHEHLYPFLEHGKCPLTEDGCFLTYKAVRQDYLDIHSGTIRNQIGDRPKMPRHKVNPDPDETCSYGLHVCSFDYLPYFSHAEGHVMVCKVDPADVVAIPRDYNNTKMRVCQYEVVAEHEGYYRNEGDTLSNTAIATEQSGFLVELTPHGADEERKVTFSRLSEASAKFEEAVSSGEYSHVALYNIATGALIDSYQDDSAQDIDENDCFDDEDLDDEFPYALISTKDGARQEIGRYATVKEALLAPFSLYNSYDEIGTFDVVDVRTMEVVKSIS